MLFISRHDGMNFYGVVDTDDGVEEVIPRNKIVQLVGDTGIEIKGADRLPDTKWVVDTHPYQDPSTMTQLQIKTKLMKFTEVKTFGNLITSIVFDYRNIREPVSIRLSDFGSSCADCILWENTQPCRHVATLIIDDKIDIGKFTFRRDESVKSLGPNGYGVVFDFREIANRKRAHDLYWQLRGNDGHRCFSYIVDNEKRYTTFKSMFSGGVQ